MKWTLPYSLYPLLLSFCIIASCLMFFLRHLYHPLFVAHHTPPVVFPPIMRLNTATSLTWLLSWGKRIFLYNMKRQTTIKFSLSLYSLVTLPRLVVRLWFLLFSQSLDSFPLFTSSLTPLSSKQGDGRQVNQNKSLW